MSKKCKVRPLCESSLGELANTVVGALSGIEYSSEAELDLSVIMVDINEYLQSAGATSNIYQDLLRVILSSEDLDSLTRFSCLQMLLNSGVQFLVTEMFPISYYEKILQVIAAQGVGLRVLNLKGVWVKEEQMPQMYEVIRCCRYLTKLHVPYIANDELLEEISYFSPHLQVLDISGETDITEIGMDLLSKGICREKLTVLDIGMPGEQNICHSDIALILVNCPNVVTFTTYAFVGLALKYVHDNVNKDFKCKLKYVHDTNTQQDTLQCIVKTCPELESLYLDSPENGILHELSKTYLYKLKIYKFNCKELMDLLASIGNHLAQLGIIKGSGSIELSHLFWLCPALTDLDCYMMDSLSYNCNRRSGKKLTLMQGLEMLSCPIRCGELKTLLCHATNLKRLAIDNVSFTDEDILSIFIENDFDQMEDLWFTMAPNLTVQSVETLIDRCPELQSVGQLSGWSLSPDDLALIRGILKSGNSCLILTPNGFFP